MSHADMNNCCGFNEAAASFSWNSPKKAINPYLDPAEVAPVSTLSNLITLYAADNEQEQLRRDAAAFKAGCAVGNFGGQRRAV